ncbi:hypothetical protein EHO59_12900 [Leptospira semungkisensis]|uniref:Lipoprotein n=1 Tax=Leptospira semungkisensis TaxID=2484985 RepID=A0A4R9FQJ4_9LEPT|nr:hypothetical protein [Leptospira semungkisensis]TGK00824.1 hypothetical protein EHO59_12900 [Leptospira semungkisensis]
MKIWKSIPATILLLASLSSCHDSSDDTTSSFLTYQSFQEILDCKVTFNGVAHYVTKKTITSGNINTVPFSRVSNALSVGAVMIVVGAGDQVTITIPGADTMTYDTYVGTCPINTNNSPDGDDAAHFSGGGGNGLNGSSTNTFTAVIPGTYTLYFAGAPPADPAIIVQVN